LIPQPDNFLFSEADGKETGEDEDDESGLRGHGIFNRRGIHIDLVSLRSKFAKMTFVFYFLNEENIIFADFPIITL
jgi:hypothetical protein